MKEPKRTDWRKNAQETDWDADDQELVQTPPDVVMVLGFDPKEEVGKSSPVQATSHDVSGEARDENGGAE